MRHSVGSPLLWVGFGLILLLMLALDLGLLRRRAAEVTPGRALTWSLIWVGAALAFNVGLYLRYGTRPALEFLTGYLIEEALSVDNLFVFLVVFSYFSVPAAYQHRVLFWGVLGAIVLRAVFILAGASLLARFHWLIYLFGGFLVLTGVRILTQGAEEVHPERNPVLRLFRRLVPMVPDYRGTRFMVRERGRWYATPLLLVLVVVEATDVVFAIDSIPAVFAVTRDPLIVYTSNIFAVMGLRSLYFVLSGMMGKFRYLKVGLGLVLAFVGIKMLVGDWIPIGTSLAVVTALLATSVFASIVNPPTEPPLPAHHHGDNPHAPPFPQEGPSPAPSEDSAEDSGSPPRQ